MFYFYCCCIFRWLAQLNAFCKSSSCLKLVNQVHLFQTVPHFLGPPDALAFYLSDRGYDVWLFNARGTELSRKHKTLNPNKDRKKFWNFRCQHCHKTQTETNGVF